VRVLEGANLLDGVAAHGVRQVLLRVLKPRVERRRLPDIIIINSHGKDKSAVARLETHLLGEGEVEFLDLAELVLQLQQALLARGGGGQQALPARRHVVMALGDGRALLVPRPHQLLLQRRDVLDALVLERR
jgi:hypothetical protein